MKPRFLVPRAFPRGRMRIVFAHCVCRTLLLHRARTSPRRRRRVPVTDRPLPVRGSSGAAAVGREAGWWCEVCVLRCVDGTTFVLYYKNMSERLITGAGMVLWGLVLLVGAR